MRTLLVAVALAMPILFVPASAQDGAQPCTEEGGTILCTFTADTRLTTQTTFTWPVPAFARTLAQVTVRFEGQDNGWKVLMRHNGTFVSEGGHQPARLVGPNARVSDTGDHLMINESTDTWTLTLVPFNYAMNDFQMSNVVGAGRSVGRFAITYAANEVPQGTAPERPASSREVPTIADPPYDGAQEATDILAVWLDDASLGDGLMDAHVAVRSFDNITWGGARQIRIGASFVVQDQYYFLIWRLSPGRDGELVMACWLGTERAANIVITMYPSCALDPVAAEVHAIFPERSVGSPGPGVLFERVEGGATNLDGGVLGGAAREDEANAQQTPFALGGPAVWDELNGCAFCPPEVAPLAWHQDPLASSNLGTSLQVAGALAASITFLIGLVIVGRRRAATRALLDEIDIVEKRGEVDPRRALLELGVLESRFTQEFREARIHESQYQVVSQRIASVATRIALRRELGLDDGTPDIRKAFRIPVQGEPTRQPAER